MINKAIGDAHADLTNTIHQAQTEPVMLTRGGKPVAVLLSVDTFRFFVGQTLDSTVTRTFRADDTPD